jgi:hypothetical protein
MAVAAGACSRTPNGIVEKTRDPDLRALGERGPVGPPPREGGGRELMESLGRIHLGTGIAGG